MAVEEAKEGMEGAGAMKQREFSAAMDEAYDRGMVFALVPPSLQNNVLRCRWSKKRAVTTKGFNYYGSYAVIFLDKLAFMAVYAERKGEE
jgi:hypothetical protein